MTVAQQRFPGHPRLPRPHAPIPVRRLERIVVQFEYISVTKRRRRHRKTLDDFPCPSGRYQRHGTRRILVTRGRAAPGYDNDLPDSPSGASLGKWSAASAHRSHGRIDDVCRGSSRGLRESMGARPDLGMMVDRASSRRRSPRQRRDECDVGATDHMRAVGDYRCDKLPSITSTRSFARFTARIGATPRFIYQGCPPLLRQPGRK